MERSVGNRIKRVNLVFMPKQEPRSSCVPTSWISYLRLGLDGPASFAGFISRAHLTAARVFLVGPSMSRASLIY